MTQTLMYHTSESSIVESVVPSCRPTAIGSMTASRHQGRARNRAVASVTASNSTIATNVLARTSDRGRDEQRALGTPAPVSPEEEPVDPRVALGPPPGVEEPLTGGLHL